MVLTAGFGVRLKPLTLFMPKPLLPIDGVPIAGHTLRQLAEFGCEMSVLNLHHLGDQIRAHFGHSYFGMPLRYSEEAKIQGTLGALRGPRSLLQDADLVLILNGDTLSRWPLKRMIRQHIKSGAEATLLLHRRTPDPELGGGIAVDANGRILAMRESEPTGKVKRRHVFAGVHLLSSSVLDHIPEGPGDIISGLYLPLLQEGRHLRSVVTRSAWHDLGTPGRYFTAAHEGVDRGWLSKSGWFSKGRRQRISPLAQIHSSAQIKNTTIEAGAQIGEEAQIEQSLLLAGARVGERCQVRDCLLGPGVHLKASISVERRMINRTPTGYQPGPQETVMGDLIYTPLET